MDVSQSSLPIKTPLLAELQETYVAMMGNIKVGALGLQKMPGLTQSSAEIQSRIDERDAEKTKNGSTEIPVEV